MSHAPNRPPSVGDKVIAQLVRQRGVEPEIDLVVYKVGRVWGYAKPEVGDWPDVKFNLDTGYDDGGGYGPTYRVLTSERFADEKRRTAALYAIRESGLGRGSFSVRHVPTQVLEQIAELLTEARKDGPAA